MGKGLFPAQMETRGPHVASVVFPRRSGAKAGRPDFQTSGQSSRPEPPSLPLPRASASLFPVTSAQSLTFVFADLAHPASPQPLPTGFGQGPGFSGFGLSWLSNGLQAALGPQDPATGLRIVQQEKDIHIRPNYLNSNPSSASCKLRGLRRGLTFLCLTDLSVK